MLFRFESRPLGKKLLHVRGVEEKTIITIVAMLRHIYVATLLAAAAMMMMRGGVRIATNNLQAFEVRVITKGSIVRKTEGAPISYLYVFNIALKLKAFKCYLNRVCYDVHSCKDTLQL